MCGKTTAACAKARAQQLSGIHVLVCDPLMSEWPCTWQTTSRPQLIAVAKRSRKCALYIDEAGQTIGRDPEAEWLFTTARHWGHKVHVLSQGGTQMTPIMRAQCSTLNLFACSPSVAEMFAEEFNDLGLLEAINLPRFHFLRKKRFEPLRGPLKIAL